MYLATPISCTMTCSELDQASRAHFALTEHLLREVQARRAAEAKSPAAQTQHRTN